MKPNNHSRTAVYVAGIRACHFAEAEPRVFSDSLASALVSSKEYEIFGKIGMETLQLLNPALAASCSDDRATSYHAMRVGAGSAIVLSRARYIEEALIEALERGVRQYVIIGAGLDTFAFRQHAFKNQLLIIEVDHPDTQQFKKERLANAGLVPPDHLCFAAVDLEKESIAVALDRTPYDPTVPTFFAWPGVAMYLSEEAIFGTLRAISNIAALGSELVFDYFEPEIFSNNISMRIQLMLQAVHQVGEPMITGLDPTMLGSKLSSAGWKLIEDLGPAEVQARLLYNANGFLAAEYWHLARITTAKINPAQVVFE